MSRLNKSVSFDEDLLKKKSGQTCTIRTPLVHSEIALSEKSKSRIPIKLPETRIKKCLLKQESKLALRAKKNLVINLPKQTTGSNTKMAERKKRTCLNEVANAQELFKIRVPRATTKFEYLCRTCKFHHVNKPRSNMPMVVIDFDALISKLTKENLSSEKHCIFALLEDLYPYYNIGTWSSLPMKDFVSLLEDHKIFEQELFKICFCLDNSSLINAFVPSLGNTKVKSLQIVWTFYPQFHQNNSVFIDESLKNIVFKHYGIADGGPLKEIAYIHESQIQLFSEYLVWFFRLEKYFPR